MKCLIQNQNQVFLIRYQLLSLFFSESKSESDSEPDFSAVFINLGICVFLTLYLHSSK